MLRRLAPTLLTLLLLASASAQTLTLYSGRGESLVQPLLDAFTRETGIEINVRYGGTSELAILLLEEGNATRADLFWSQDGGALGVLANNFRLAPLPAAISGDLPNLYRNRSDTWVATSGRARVLAYSPSRTVGDPRIDSVTELTDARFAGRVGWAPTNASFQTFVTALRVTLGETATRGWLEAMIAGGAKAYRNNTALIEAIAAGEIDYAITNHYYLLRYLAQDANYPVAQRFFADGDVGNLVNVAGVGILQASRRYDLALQFVAFLLSESAQAYFTSEVGEYPVLPSATPNPRLVDEATLLQAAPDLDLDQLDDLDGTLELLREVGLL
jgi:iron(III) transport system substrate-binding protein